MSERVAIKVLLIDNHPLVLDGLKAVLQTFENIEVVGSAGSAADGLELAKSNRPQVVLMDINMPKLNGIEAIELFRSVIPDVRIVMLSMHDSKEYISSSVMRGAAGYVLKDVSTDEIVKAIETVVNGGSYFSTGVSEILMDRVSNDDGALTPREKETLTHIAAGKSNREMAAILGISESTVETHRKKLKRKLGISSTAGLIRYALDHAVVVEQKKAIPTNG
jgi:two-component system nitrate/nitrite response regulator NarL